MNLSLELDPHRASIHSGAFGVSCIAVGVPKPARSFPETLKGEARVFPHDGSRLSWDARTASRNPIPRLGLHRGFSRDF
jgi:hypothetical protein